MSEQVMSKELTLTHPSVPKISSKPPRFITLENGREVATRLTVSGISDYVDRRAREKFIPIGELASVFCGGNTPAGKKRIRRNLSLVAIEMVNKYRQILLTETEGPHHRVRAVKLCNPAIPGEQQAAIAIAQKMKRRREITSQRYEAVMQTLLEFCEAESATA